MTISLGDLKDNSFLRTLPGTLSVDSISVFRLSSFNRWKSLVYSGLEDNEKFLHNSLEHWRNLLDSVLTYEQSVYVLQGPADILIYKWSSPTSEIKILPVWSSRLILQNDLQWIKYYPFLKEVSSSDTLNDYLLNTELLAKTYTADPSHSILLPSHNNHIGHFFGDDFPMYACFLRTSINSFSQKFAYPISYANSILDALSLCNLPANILNYNLSAKTHPNSFTILKSSKVFSFQASSNLLNSFLWRTYMNKNPFLVLQKTLTKKYFIARTGQYESRISNLTDILQLVDEFGLIPIDPSQYSLPKLINLLSDAQCILAESGTATLNACMFSPASCKVVSLNSERYLFRPSNTMVSGGLQYLCGYLDKITLFAGTVVTQHSIESSDQCFYNISELRALLKCLL